MPTLPYPVQSTEFSEFATQVLAMFRDIYEEKIGGATLGDVFQIAGDTFEIKLKSGSGLQKTGGELDFDTSIISSTGAIMKTLLTAKGSLISASGVSTPATVTVGTNGQVLSSDSTKSAGLAWITLTAALIGLGVLDSPEFAGLTITSNGKIVLRDAALHIASLDDGHLDLTADVSIDLNGAVLGSSTIESTTGFKCGGTTAITDGTYTIGYRLTPAGTDGTITVKGGIVTAIQEAT